AAGDADQVAVGLREVAKELCSVQQGRNLARFHEANVQRSTFDVQRSNAELLPGSARSPRVGDRVLAIADFPAKDCFGETPKPARETRALPGKSWERFRQSRSVRGYFPGIRSRI